MEHPRIYDAQPIIFAALIFLAGAFGYTAWTNQEPVWLIDQTADAPPQKTLRVSGSSMLEQTWQPQSSRLSALFLKTDRLGSFPLQLEISQSERAFPPISLSVLSQPLLKSALVLPDSVDPQILAGAWLVVPIDQNELDPGAVAKFTITTPADRELFLAYEADSSYFSGGSLKYNGQGRSGNVGFMTASRAGIFRSLAYRLFTLHHFIYLYIWLTISLSAGLLWHYLRFRTLNIVWLSALFALAYTMPLYQDMTNFGTGDWQEAASYYAAIKHSISAGQFPAWNPYLCGGVPLWADPIGYLPSLGLIISLILGPVFGTKVATTLAVWIGLAGAFFLARWLGLSRLASFLAAAIFMLGGFFSGHLAAGHFLWLSLAWIPWVLFLFLSSKKHPRRIFFAALVYVLLLFEGPVYFAVYTALILPPLAMSEAWRLGHWRWFVRAHLIFGSLVSGLAAIKLLPMLVYRQGLSASLSESFGLPLNRLPLALLSRSIPAESAMTFTNNLTWNETQAYIGILPVLLALFYFGLSLFHRRYKYLAWSLLIISIFFGLITISQSPAANPFEYLPLLNQLRTHSRAIFGLVFSLALAAGLGLDFLRAHIKPTGLALAAAQIIVIAILVDLILYSAPLLARIYTLPPKFYSSDQPFEQVGQNFNNGYHIVASGHGAVEYCPPHARHWRAGSRIDADRHPFVSSATGDDVVRLDRFSPNRLMIALGEVSEDDRVIINQRYGPGWTSRQVSVKPDDGLMSFDVSPEAANTQIELQYKIPLFHTGLLISISTFIIAIILLVRISPKKLFS